MSDKFYRLTKAGENGYLQHLPVHVFEASSEDEARIHAKEWGRAWFEAADWSHLPGESDVVVEVYMEGPYADRACKLYGEGCSYGAAPFTFRTPARHSAQQAKDRLSSKRKVEIRTAVYLYAIAMLSDTDGCSFLIDKDNSQAEIYEFKAQAFALMAELSDAI